MTTSRDYRRRPLFWLLLALSLTAQSGCILLFRNSVTLKRAYVLTDPADRDSPRDRFFEFRSRRDARIGDVPFGIFVAPFELRQPFSFEGLVGILDPIDIPASADARGCIEIDEEGFFGEIGHFYFQCVTYELAPVAGIRVSTSVDANTVFYPGVYGGIARMESDPTDLDFLFQPLGGVGWDTITSTPFSSTSSWHPSVGGIIPGKGGVVGFDRIRTTSTPLPSPTLEEQAAEEIEDGLRRLAEACYELDGASPDYAGAMTEFNAAFGHIGAALGYFPLFPDRRLARRVERKIERMDRLAWRAHDAALDLRLETALKNDERAIRQGGEGLQILRNLRLDL